MVECEFRPGWRCSSGKRMALLYLQFQIIKETLFSTKGALDVQSVVVLALWIANIMCFLFPPDSPPQLQVPPNKYEKPLK